MLQVGDKVSSEDMTKLGQARQVGFNIVLNRDFTKVRFMSKSKQEALDYCRKVKFNHRLLEAWADCPIEVK